MSAIDQHIRALATDGIRIHRWPCAAGYQANVSEPATNAWTCHTAADPVEALATALRMRVARVSDRVVVGSAEAEPDYYGDIGCDQVSKYAAATKMGQTDIMDVLTASALDDMLDDPFDDMFED